MRNLIREIWSRVSHEFYFCFHTPKQWKIFIHWFFRPLALAIVKIRIRFLYGFVKWVNRFIPTLRLGAEVNRVSVVPLERDRRDISHTMEFWEKYYEEAGEKLTKKKAKRIQENILKLGLKLKENDKEQI